MSSLHSRYAGITSLASSYFPACMWMQQISRAPASLPQLFLQHHTHKLCCSICGNTPKNHNTPTVAPCRRITTLLMHACSVNDLFSSFVPLQYWPCQFLFSGETSLAALSALIMRFQNLLTSILCIYNTHMLRQLDHSVTDAPVTLLSSERCLKQMCSADVVPTLRDLVPAAGKAIQLSSKQLYCDS